MSRAALFPAPVPVGVRLRQCWITPAVVDQHEQPFHEHGPVIDEHGPAIDEHERPFQQPIYGRRRSTPGSPCCLSFQCSSRTCATGIRIHCLAVFCLYGFAICHVTKKETNHFFFIMFLPALSPHQRRTNGMLPSQAPLSPLRVEETGHTPNGQPQNKRAIETFTVAQANALALSFHLSPVTLEIPMMRAEPVFTTFTAWKAQDRGGIDQGQDFYWSC